MRLLIDCDPGIDDALALYALLGHPSLTLQGITTVFGNVSVRQATRNIARLWQLAGGQPLPRVGEGAEQPLVGSRLPRRAIHGRDGLGDLDISLAPLPQPLFESTPLITELLRAHALDGMIALGPLTNMAHAFASAPRLLARVPSIVVMGGVVVEGNESATEFNLASDPAAARCLLGSNACLRWVPLNTAASVVFGMDAIEAFRAAHGASRLAATMAKLLVYSAHARPGTPGAVLPDAVAVALALEPSLGEWRQRRLALADRMRSGRLSVEAGVPNAQVCERVDAQGVMKLLWGLWTRCVEPNDATHS